MTGNRLLFIFIAVFLVLRLSRYALGARVFLTSALRSVIARPCAAEEVPDGERELLMSLDQLLLELGLRPLGFITYTPLLTYYGESDYLRLFADGSGLVEAHVFRRLAPEFGFIVSLACVTRLKDGRAIVTSDQPLPTADTEQLGQLMDCVVGRGVAETLARHQERLEGQDLSRLAIEPATLESVAVATTSTFADARRLYRQRRWVRATDDATLDRFTLKGAFALTNRSLKAFGRRGTKLSVPAEPTAANRAARIEADYQCVRHIARFPVTARGIPWPLLSMIGITALASVLAMAAFWSSKVAITIFTVLLVHEAGHALAMRLVGHTSVHIFFLPLLGALTVGRATDTSVRQRLVILLAGPLPGLFIGVLLLLGYPAHHDGWWLGTAFGFVVINALNLLPVIPLDGGRFFETLTRPEGVARPVLQGASVAGLIAVAWVLKDPVFAGLAALSAFLIPRQLLAYRFRRELGRQVAKGDDWLAVARKALAVMTAPQFGQWRSPMRQGTARAAADQFTAPVATPWDWVIGMAMYLAGIVVLLIAAVLWHRVRSA